MKAFAGALSIYLGVLIGLALTDLSPRIEYTEWTPQEEARVRELLQGVIDSIDPCAQPRANSACGRPQ